MGAYGRDAWSVGLWRSMLRRRTMAIVVIASLVLVVPSMGSRRWLVAAAVLVIGIGYHVVLGRASLRTGCIPWWIAVTDPALWALVPLIEPRTFAPALFVSVSIISLLAIAVGTRLALLATGIATGLVAVAALVGHPTMAVVSIAAMAVAATMSAVTVGAISSNAGRLHQQMRQYVDLVERINLGLVVMRLTDVDDERSLVLVAANPTACAALDQSIDEQVGHRLRDVIPAVAGTDLERSIADVVRTGRTFEVDGLTVRAGEHDQLTLSLSAFPLPGDVVAVALEDVTVATTAVQALRRQALHDGLTGLPNRSQLRTALAVAMDPAARQAGVALLVMDLDQFKEINDALGHHVGDLLLVELSGRLRRLVDGHGLVARLGGDEFAVLMTGVDVADAEAMAAAIQTDLLEPFAIGDLRLQTNASIGIAHHPDHADDPDSLTQRADVAMYQAKRAGLGSAVYRAEHDRSSIRRITLISQLRRALDADEFVLHFQPLIDLTGGRTVRAEALVRWEHPEHGLIPPNDFIELAEVSGFIQPLTRWIVSQAAEAAESWRRQGHDVGVAVNLSVRNLYDPTLPAHVAEVLHRTGLPPSLLTLEVTESELMDDPVLALEVLNAINVLGVETSVDDFGTGYSSLAYLRNLPIGEIKIDRSFVAGIEAGSDDLTIVRSTIELGHNLGLQVVAEGVEDAATLGRLEGMGCDLAQGYHISRPLPIEAFRAWLDSLAGNGPAGTPADAAAPRH